MTNYSAISIGPIVKTLMMARKPRELWAASYLFSLLMKTIVTNHNDGLISPAIDSDGKKKGVGLYPDRAFWRGKSKEDVWGYIDESWDEFVNACKTKLSRDYFNLMVVDGEFDKDAIAIQKLNKQLDILELFSDAKDEASVGSIQKLILQNKDNEERLYEALMLREFEKLPRATLAEYATAGLSDKPEWKEFEKEIRDNEKNDTKAFEHLRKYLKSHHKYICVVQADGDNVGKTVSNTELPDGKVKEISEALLGFGKKAKTAITEYGGMPIYAGGDDLLFIAPVVNGAKNILDLLDDLNNNCFGDVKNTIKDCQLKDEGKVIEASLSFGISISYYKYPLYEALENARNLLFGQAKNVDGKNAVAIDLRKHSGGSFSATYSRNNKELDIAFREVIKSKEAKETVVSAVAHKIRSNSGLLNVWLKADADYQERNKNFFKKFMEHEDGDQYKDAALKLLNVLYATEIQRAEIKKTEPQIDTVTQNTYGMLRIAKFINGEEAGE